jgi:hypothetical protein
MVGGGRWEGDRAQGTEKRSCSSRGRGEAEGGNEVSKNHSLGDALT